MMTKGRLAPVGSTGNNTHAGQSLPGDMVSLALEFEITAVGGTPTVTFKFQGSLDDSDTPDASSDWFDLMVLPSDADVAVATATKTAVGAYTYFLANARLAIRKVRVVTSANTNVTYEADFATR